MVRRRFPYLGFHQTSGYRRHDEDGGQQQKTLGIGFITSRNNPAIHRLPPLNEYGGDRYAKHAAEMAHVADDDG